MIPMMIFRTILVTAGLLAVSAAPAFSQYETDTLPSVAPVPTGPSSAVPPTSFDVQARFLSGRRLPPGSRLAQLQSAPWYLEHASGYSGLWRRFDERYFSKMRAWSQREVLPRIGAPSTVFYLFGGPDFINAFALFPDAQMTILGGLEPVGSMAPMDQLDETRLAAGLAGLRESTSVTLQFSHFITKDMKVEFEKTDFKGVLPILLSFVSLGGAEILDVRFVGITPSGVMQTVESAGTNPAVLLPGVQIDFQRGQGKPIQSVIYVQADLSDGALKANPGFLRWMSKFTPAVSYLKAASYLMHESYFSTVRNFLLSGSRAILQDDSGIPLNYFASGSWRLAFFGNYNGTLGIFKKYYQSDLAQAYAGGMPVFPLDFGTGYKWKLGESNLMLAVRENSPVETPAPGPGVVPNR